MNSVETIVAKGRNCLLRALSSFVTMFSKSLLLQRRQTASVCGKGLRPSQQMTYENLETKGGITRTKFSTWFNNYIFMYWYFLYIYLSFSISSAADLLYEGKDYINKVKLYDNVLYHFHTCRPKLMHPQSTTFINII